MLLMHGFAVLRISVPGPSQKKTDVFISNVHSGERKLVFALEAQFSKRSQVTCLSVPLKVQEKRTFRSISPI